jgi:hypothetical protein
MVVKCADAQAAAAFRDRRLGSGFF